MHEVDLADAGKLPTTDDVADEVVKVEVYSTSAPDELFDTTRAYAPTRHWTARRVGVYLAAVSCLIGSIATLAVAISVAANASTCEAMNVEGLTPLIAEGCRNARNATMQLLDKIEIV